VLASQRESAIDELYHYNREGLPSLPQPGRARCNSGPFRFPEYNVVEDTGWGSDHVGKLDALQRAIKRLCGPGKIRDRFDAGTFPLVTYQERDFPEQLRPAFRRILDARLKSRHEVTLQHVVFAFDSLTSTERKQIVADVQALYEACLIDIGRAWPESDFVYPKGDIVAKSKKKSNRGT
jgi:hypothetical protein